MRLPGRLAAAIEVLADITARHRPVGEALKAWGLDHRFAGAADRAAIGNLVYDALRRRASHGFAMGDDAPRALVLSVAVRDWGEAVEALAAGFADDSHAPAPLSEDERARLSAPDPLKHAPDFVRADLPPWVAPHFAAGFGTDWIDEGAALATRPPLDLRVNRLKADRDKVLKTLARFSPVPLEQAPLGVRLVAGPRDARTPNVTVDEGYLKGWFEVQDQGSQLAAALAGARPGEQVLDLCAGAGGKSLALAAAMGNKGQIFAYDRDRHRLAPIYERLQRNGVRNVQVRPPAEGALDDLVGKMDRVVVDAPCTGAGTWRRRPDAKWKLTPEQLAARADEQAGILAEGATYVRPGGVLVYITCSVFPEENDMQIARFLAAVPGFAQRQPEEAVGYTTAFGLQLSPFRTGTDGFYVGMLERRAR